VPRSVDHEARRREVAQAAIRLLAEKGPRGLTLRGLAAELGGSITLVTHFFRNRGEILAAVTQLMIEESAEELAELDRPGISPEDRLRGFLLWLLPTTAETHALERGRVMMAGESDASFNVQDFYDTWERAIRDLIARFLPDTLPPDQQAFFVDLVRVIQNGVVLSAVEHPKYWTAEKQHAFIDELIPLVVRPAANQSGR
jgi:AcrR family transcriptional regulator